MKVFRHSILISALPLLLLAASCDLHTEDVAEEGTGTIVLNITSPDAMQTRHADDDDSSAASDGGIMKTLCIWLVRTSDDVILEHKDLTPNAATATAEFKDVARGNYYFCVLANYKGLDGYEAGEKIDDDFKNALVSAQATNSTTTTTTTTTTLAAGQAPSFETDGMPLSYVKTIDVAAGKNVLDVSLKRCVGRLTINLRNTLSNYDLFVHSLNISENNQTQGYLFPRLGSTDPIPSTSEMVAFPDLTSLIEIDPKTQVEVYDYYLYETNPGTALTINMLAALYPINTSVSSVKVNSRTETDIEVGGNTSAIVGPTYYYMIRSGYSSNYYLVDNGSSGSGSLGTDSIDSDSEITSMSQEDLKKYLWTFSGSTGNSTTVMNVSTGNFLTISSSGASLSSASETLTTKESSQYGVRLMSGNYNMTFDGTSIGVTEDVQNNKQILWYVRPVREGDNTKLKYYFENPSVELARGYHEIKYLDVYGAPQPLTKIDRNEHVTLNISLFYNTELAQFDFAVSDWTDGGNRETTFD